MTFSQFLEEYLPNFIWGLAAFLIFVVILLRVGVTKILVAVQNREDKIAKELKEAEDAYARAKKVQADVDAKFAAAESRIAELMATARKDAESYKSDLVEKGRVEIDAMRQRALVDIEAARHTALMGLRQQIADIAITVSEKIVRERLDPARHEALVSQTMDAYSTAREKR